MIATDHILNNTLETRYNQDVGELSFGLMLASKYHEPAPELQENSTCWTLHHVKMKQIWESTILVGTEQAFIGQHHGIYEIVGIS